MRELSAMLACILVLAYGTLVEKRSFNFEKRGKKKQFSLTDSVNVVCAESNNKSVFMFRA